MRSKDLKIVLSLLATEEKAGVSQIVNCEDYSSIDRLLRVTAYVLRFVNRLRQSGRSVEATTMLNAQEISLAENLWIKESQHQLVGDRNFEGWKMISSLTKLASGGVVEGYLMPISPTRRNTRSCYLETTTSQG